MREDCAAALCFLDDRLADATSGANRKRRITERFLADEGDEKDLQVRNVSVEDLRTPPNKATVDFEKIFSSSLDHLKTTGAV